MTTELVASDGASTPGQSADGGGTSATVTGQSISRYLIYPPTTRIFNITASTVISVSLELDRECPACSNDTFWRTASTVLHLGEKTKWVCTECDYGLVRIGGIDSAAR
jgi:hypothetical protein